MSTLKIRKISNSLGVIFSKEIQVTLRVSEGDSINFTLVRQGQVVLESHIPLIVSEFSKTRPLTMKTNLG